jgi:hypothetical protein
MGAELPDKVFNREFEKYIFFDADISSSEEMISAVRDVVIWCFDSDIDFQVFSSSSRDFLGHIQNSVDWLTEISRIGKAIRESGDVGGLTLVDSKKRWVAYQSRPVDIGVFAIDCPTNLSRMQGIKDSFFDCVDISIWIRQETPRDADLATSFGEEFLVELLKNYC